MNSNRFLLLPNAKQNIFNGTIDLDTNPMYAVALHADLVPTMAMLTYGDLAIASSGAITGATQANPVVITATAHGRVTGDRVSFAGIVGMTQLNGNTYNITVIDANSYSLQSAVTGVNVDGTAFTAYTSGGTWTRDYARVALTGQAIIASGQDRAFDCADIIFGNPITLTAKLYAVCVGSAAAPNAGDLCVGWELFNPTSGVITNVTNASPAVVTSNGHGLVNTDPVLIQGVDMIDIDTLNDDIHLAAGVTANTFELGTLNLAAASLVGRRGWWTKINSTGVSQSQNNEFKITIPANGLFAY